jgi:cobaltochelatase CobT
VPERRSPVDRFTRALAQATRALAGRRKVEIGFGPATRAADRATPRLAEPAAPLDAAAVARLRGHADRLALRLAHHDPALHALARPTDPRAGALFDAIEGVRCEALGARGLPGVARNLAAALAEELARATPSAAAGDRGTELARALPLWLRERLAGASLPPVATALLTSTQDELERRAGATVDRLRPLVADQAAFARLGRELLGDLGLACDPARPAGERPRRPGLRLAVPRATPTDAPEFTISITPAPDDAAAASVVPQAPRGPTHRPTDTEPSSPIGPTRRAHRAPASDYRVFTRAHDETQLPERDADPTELDRLGEALQTQARPFEAELARLAHRLERRLLTPQRRHWRFDQDDGVLDTQRLSRVIADPSGRSAYKVAVDAGFKDTIVTLLVDNSGSLRGTAIVIAALCADFLARALERCGVKVEILGFTTREWNGGRSREEWLRAGSPRRPGRLSDLRHVIYKSADAPARRARRNLGWMLHADLLKENVDGEALGWAHERLLARSERRRILLVISDGMPLDESTLSENGSGFLERHLREVIAWIERSSPIELIAIGVGHDVGHFYARATTVPRIEALGTVLFDRVAELFTTPPSRR